MQRSRVDPELQIWLGLLHTVASMLATTTISWICGERRIVVGLPPKELIVEVVHAAERNDGVRRHVEEPRTW